MYCDLFIWYRFFKLICVSCRRITISREWCFQRLQKLPTAARLVYNLTYFTASESATARVVANQCFQLFDRAEGGGGADRYRALIRQILLWGAPRWVSSAARRTQGTTFTSQSKPCLSTPNLREGSRTFSSLDLCANFTNEQRTIHHIVAGICPSEDLRSKLLSKLILETSHPEKYVP